MKRFLDALRAASFGAIRAISAGWRRSVEWLSVSSNFCVAFIAALFLASLASWALADPYEEAILFFPDGQGALRGELRDLPRSRGREERAELVVSEILLGPRSPGLVPAFEPGTRLESAIYRKGRLYVNLAPQAALAPPESLKRGLGALERSLELALPGLGRTTIAIGGNEPFMDRLPPEKGNDEKSAGK